MDELSSETKVINNEPEAKHYSKIDRPNINSKDLQKFFTDNFSVDVSYSEELKAFWDRNFFVEIKTTSDELTPFQSLDLRRLVVKVTNLTFKNRKKWTTLKDITKCLETNGFICTQVASIHAISKNDSDYLILILKYIPGNTLLEHWHVLDKISVIMKAGEMVAQLHNTLQAMDPSMLSVNDDTDDPWILDNAAVMIDLLHVIEDKETTAVIRSVIQNFVTLKEEVESSLVKGIIHGDLHDLNLIVNCKEHQLIPFTPSPPDAKKLFGIIDFGDMCISCYIFEVGQIIRDFMATTNPDNCYDVAQTFLSGYFRYRALNKKEINILFPTILTALCQYYVMGVYEFNRQPDNPTTKEGSEEAFQLVMKYYDSCDEFMLHIKRFLLKQ